MHHVFSFECARLLRILRLIHSHFFIVILTFFDIKRITKFLLSFCWLSSKIQHNHVQGEENKLRKNTLITIENIFYYTELGHSGNSSGVRGP